MAKQLTPRHGLIQPGENDYYDVQDQNRNMGKLDRAVVSDGLAQVVTLAQTEYDAALHPADVLYIVTDTGRMYLGDIPIGGDGGSAHVAGNILVTTSGIVAAAPYIAGSTIPSYDETKIAVVLLDENDEPTYDIIYFETIADTVTYLKNNASNRYLVHIGTTAGVNSLSGNAFLQCSSLVLIDIASSVTGIGSDALSGTSLKTVDIPNSVTGIQRYAFRENYYLTSVHLSENITEILDRTFDNCVSLNSIDLPQGLTQIGERAFRNCRSLNSITISSSITSIHSAAFEYCDGITITINKPQNSISGSPWGATNATVVWTG